MTERRKRATWERGHMMTQRMIGTRSRLAVSSLTPAHIHPEDHTVSTPPKSKVLPSKGPNAATLGPTVSTQTYVEHAQTTPKS